MAPYYFNVKKKNKVVPILVLLVILAAIAAGVWFFVVPKLQAAKDREDGVRSTLTAAAEAYTNRDCNAFLDTIEPEQAEKVKSLLDSAETAAGRAGEFMSGAANVLSALGVQLPDAVNDVLDGNTVLNRDTFFAFLADNAESGSPAGIAAEDIKVLHIEPEGENGVRIMARYAPSGSEGAGPDYVILGMKYHEETGRWYISSVCDEDGKTSALRFLLTL